MNYGDLIIVTFFVLAGRVADYLDENSTAGYECPQYCAIDHSHMREYKVKGKMHKVYEPDEVPIDIKPVAAWQEAKIGDWVVADDGCVIQVLRRYGKIIGTCTGSYTASTGMDTEKTGDIYSISGKTWEVRTKERKTPTYNEIIFASFVNSGDEPVEAYLKVYKTKNKEKAKARAILLVKQKRIQNLMREELKLSFGKSAIDLDWLISSAKDLVDGGKNDSDRINALKMLWDAWGVVEKRPVTEVRGVIQEFSPKQLDAVLNPQLGSGNEEE
jgi:hypothetical protein